MTEGAGNGSEDSAAGNRVAGTRDGDGWTDDRYEYRPVRIEGDVSRLTASVRLAIQADPRLLLQLQTLASRADRAVG